MRQRAVAGVMSLPAYAVNVSQNNVGQVLLFPYYTVKNGFDTIFSVTNTSNRTVVAKVRWRCIESAAPPMLRKLAAYSPSPNTE